jgi:hypothetical protein
MHRKSEIVKNIVVQNSMTPISLLIISYSPEATDFKYCDIYLLGLCYHFLKKILEQGLAM